MIFNGHAIAIVHLLMMATGAAREIGPLENAHAHNDYWHKRPLWDALDQGFTSVEADIFLIDGKLLVGHDRDELRPERTLETLYLAPLEKRARENGGRIHLNARRFFLLIDIKSDSQTTYPQLHKLLSKYAHMLTVIEGENVRQGAVTVVISGNRPPLDQIDKTTRYCGLDGRIHDLHTDIPSHFMPMISDHWPSHFTWMGNAPMPEQERAKLRQIVNAAHKAGRVVRFWATPENETVWRELRLAGVDLIGTDRLDKLAAFLRGNANHARSSFKTSSGLP